jgi:hypothetical protein
MDSPSRRDSFPSPYREASIDQPPALPPYLAWPGLPTGILANARRFEGASAHPLLPDMSCNITTAGLMCEAVPTDWLHEVAFVCPVQPYRVVGPPLEDGELRYRTALSIVAAVVTVKTVVRRREHADVPPTSIPPTSAAQSSQSPPPAPRCNTKYGKTIRIKSPSPSAISPTRDHIQLLRSAGNSPLRFAAALHSTGLHGPRRRLSRCDVDRE